MEDPRIISALFIFLKMAYYNVLINIMWNGKCLTARISESLSPEKECILSDILMKDVPEKYYLSPEQTRRLLFKSSQAAKGAEFIPKTD